MCGEFSAARHIGEELNMPRSPAPWRTDRRQKIAIVAKRLGVTALFLQETTGSAVL
jgi:hypothetical protein